MAAFGWTSAHGNISYSGIASWIIKPTGSTGTYDLGALADGTVTATALTGPNSYGRDKPYGIAFEAKAKMLYTDEAAVLEKLGILCGALNVHKITMVDGVTFVGSFGLTWTFDSSSDYQGYRYVEITANHVVLIDHATATDWANLISDTLAAVTADAGDTLYGFIPATMFPAGFSGFEIRNRPTETAYETPGLFRSGKLTAATVNWTDSRGRNFGSKVKIDFSVELVQGSGTELALIDNYLAGTPDARCTLADGTLFTFADLTGVKLSMSDSGNFDNPRVITLSGGGIFTFTQWATIVSI